MPLPTLTFPPFSLDPANACLWRGNTQLPLMPKDFAVLHALAVQAGQLVTKEDLLSVVWGETRVSGGVLKNSIERIRRALGDSAMKPRFIETVHGRGYRFLPSVTTQPVQSAQFTVLSSDTQDSILRTQHSALVGRETELTQLHGWLNKAQSGQRQLVFVTGEPGIGKTTLIEIFLKSLESSVQRLESENQKPLLSKVRTLDSRPQTLDAHPWVGHGQCVESYGAGEAYMPLLVAFERLCRTAEGAYLVGLLRQYAPLWLAQMPSLIQPTEREGLQHQLMGSTPERMLREIAQAVETLTVERPLVLVL